MRQISTNFIFMVLYSKSRKRLIGSVIIEDADFCDTTLRFVKIFYHLSHHRHSGRGGSGGGKEVALHVRLVQNGVLLSTHGPGLCAHSAVGHIHVSLAKHEPIYAYLGKTLMYSGNHCGAWFGCTFKNGA